MGWRGVSRRGPGKAPLLEYADAWRNPPELPAQHNDDAIVNRQMINRYGRTIALADEARGGIIVFPGKRPPVGTT